MSEGQPIDKPTEPLTNNQETNSTVLPQQGVAQPVMTQPGMPKQPMMQPGIIPPQGYRPQQPIYGQPGMQPPYVQQMYPGQPMYPQPRNAYAAWIYSTTRCNSYSIC